MSNSATTLDLINDYYAQKPNFNDRIGKERPAKPPADQLEQLDLNQNPYLRALLGKRKMPIHPAEEHATGNITDQIAKESKDSTASDHGLHQEGTGATSGGSISAAAAHKANPGPVKADNIGEPASKEELRKRAEELNK